MYLSYTSCFDDIFLNKIFFWLKRKRTCNIKINFLYICLIKVNSIKVTNIDSF